MFLFRQGEKDWVSNSCSSDANLDALATAPSHAWLKAMLYNGLHVRLQSIPTWTLGRVESMLPPPGEIFGS